MDTYEKKYKEALELARDYYKANLKLYNADENVILEDIFPELCESEDEMIRKWLIGYFNQYIIDGMPQVFGNGLNVKDVIAWLGKQGEQKSTDETPYPETLEKAIDLYYYSYGNGKGEFEHLSLEKFRDIVHTFVSDYGQKPAWSEEDERILNGLISSLVRIGANTRTDSTSINYTFPREINWLKLLKQRMGG